MYRFIELDVHGWRGVPSRVWWHRRVSPIKYILLYPNQNPTLYRNSHDPNIGMAINSHWLKRLNPYQEKKKFTKVAINQLGFDANNPQLGSVDDPRFFLAVFGARNPALLLAKTSFNSLLNPPCRVQNSLAFNRHSSSVFVAVCRSAFMEFHLERESVERKSYLYIYI